MFDVKVAENGDVFLEGRFDATQVERAREDLGRISSSCRVHFEDLDYIASAGLGILLSVQKRLRGSGQGLTLVGLNKHIREVFKIAGFDQVFEIE
jgi:stage II sporulation protein AA (anti-sigma F factor antagonist)